ncbi:hypothetical protein [Thiorhodococcus minor]|uniref:Sulfotransferase family protein n=1 Tax=Thiorhodococcus minor TaxID=57489 RepID=A0A6M0JTJ7_9GAMM|nr:hypothetical protein [Thiorhodococcus minor]NEV60856.1 hypothetical protein [Thiorhodococcus minor]
MTRIVLHIGLEKTGTTSIQRFCSTNRQRLWQQHGILYPAHPALRQDEAHAALTAALLPPNGCDFVDPEARPEVVEVMAALEDALAAKPEILVLSSEHLSSRLSSAGISQLAQLLCLHPVEVLVYLRRQEDMGVAAFSTHLKCGRRAWFRPREISPRNSYYDFLGKLAPWAEIFGRETIRVRLYDPTYLTHGDVLEDFLDALGIRDASGYRREKPLNTSLNVAEAALLHWLNQALPTWDEAVRRGRPEDYHRAHQIRLRILKDASGIPEMRQAPPLSTVLTRLDRARIRQRFERANARIARDYLGRAQLFAEDKAMPRRGARTLLRPRPHLDERALAEVLLSVAGRLQDSFELPKRPPSPRGLRHSLGQRLLRPFASRPQTSPSP